MLQYLQMPTFFSIEEVSGKNVNNKILIENKMT